MTEMIILQDEPERPQPDECKGLFFRCESNYFLSGETYVERTRMRLLKRRSCPGCDKCWPLWDELGEEAGNANAAYKGAFTTDPPEIAPYVEHGGVYQLRVQVDSTDWETGYVDDYHMVFDLMKE